MINDFKLFFGIGWEHIISKDALDHILFIGVLTALFTIADFKHLLILVTAFTVGHSLTLALSVFKIIEANTSWVEFLIPCTIVFTALHNLYLLKKEIQLSLPTKYSMALFFGLIHGLGFANTISFMLSEKQGIGWPLFSFNLGLEAGQIVLVIILSSIAWIIRNKWSSTAKYWVLLISLVSLFLAGYFAIYRWPI